MGNLYTSCLSSLLWDGIPVYTAAQERKKRTCSCLKNGIRDCRCDRAYSQPDCNMMIPQEVNYFGIDLYMLTAQIGN